ncbi:MAG: carboxypeptidase regulatory-like domain-containing protein [Planctomycetes bacterium]|nr:carboxypeptidase regulatory-like domain-containing protein [Planctomycetota bacterium]
MRSLLPALLVALVVTALLALWWRDGVPSPTPGSGAVHLPTPPVVEPAAAPAPPTAAAPSDRQVATAAPLFTSFDEDGEPIADPVRDGLVLWVCSTRGVPAVEVPVTAHWRKGFGLYGRDVGRTDARGRFATTVAEVEQFEGIEVQEPNLGVLEYPDELLPTAEDPRTVQLVVPELAPLRVRVVDGRGGPVAGAGLVATGGGHSPIPRQHLLRGKVREVTADAAGAAEMLLPLGSYEITAAAADCTLPQSVLAEVGAAGGSATVVLLRDAHRIDVTVHVTTPPGPVALVKVDAFTRSVPDRAGMPGRGGEGIYRELFVDRQGEPTFVVRADGLAWRCVAKSEGCDPGVVDVPAGRTEVQVSLASAASKAPATKARLVVTVLDPEGNPTYADVRVHETPDLVHGSDRSTGNGGRLVLELEPEGRVCVSASRSGFARCVAGPFELSPGEQQVELRLLRPQAIAGRVVDAAGNEVEATVCLRRPAGALRGLTADAPAILEDGPTQDHLGTLPDGVFSFRDCGPGEHELVAFPADGRLPARRRAFPGETVTLVLGEGLADLAVVSGTVRDATTLAPVADAELWSPLAFALSVRSNAEGRFQFATRPGALQLRVSRRGYAVFTTPPRIVTTAPLVLDVALPPSPLRFLRVLDTAGRPVPDAEVAVFDAEGEPIDLLDEDGCYDGTSRSADAAGRVDLRGAPGGSLRVRIRIGDRQQVFAVPATGGLQAAFDLRWTD